MSFHALANHLDRDSDEYRDEERAEREYHARDEYCPQCGSPDCWEFACGESERDDDLGFGFEHDSAMESIGWGDDDAIPGAGDVL
jgi:hypothetical protein